MTRPDEELSMDDRALIELARDAHDPSDWDQARVRAALASRLGVAAGLGVGAGIGAAVKAAGVATGGGAGAAGAGALGAGVAVKLIGAAVAVSLTVGVGAKVVHRHRRAPLAPAHVVSKATPPVEARRPAVAAPAQPSQALEPAIPAAAPVLVPAPVPAPTPAAKPPAHAHRIATEVPAPRKPAPALADEAGLLHAGLVARRSGQPARALELFDRHALLYPQGVLAEERDAERALALADLGRAADARAAIADFLRAHPTSPLGARLRDRQRQLDAKPAP